MHNQLNHTIVDRFRMITGFFLIGLILIFIFADRGTMPEVIARLYAFPGGDLAGHFLLMGLFALLVNGSLGFRVVQWRGQDLLLGSMLVGVIVALEEVSQAFFVTRSASVVDLSASILGIIVFGRLGLKVFVRNAG